MRLPDIFRALALLGLNIGDIARAALHWLTPVLAKPAFREALARTDDDQARDLGELCRLAAEALDQEEPNREEAAEQLAILVGELKLF